MKSDGVTLRNQVLFTLDFGILACQNRPAISPRRERWCVIQSNPFHPRAASSVTNSLGLFVPDSFVAVSLAERREGETFWLAGRFLQSAAPVIAQPRIRNPVVAGPGKPQVWRNEAPPNSPQTPKCLHHHGNC